jgi:serine/threonine protein kinase
LSAVS